MIISLCYLSVNSAKTQKLNKLSGQELFEIVIQKIGRISSNCRNSDGILDSINHPKVIQFYEQFGFVAYSQLIKDDHQVTYQPMALNMSPIKIRIMSPKLMT